MSDESGNQQDGDSHLENLPAEPQIRYGAANFPGDPEGNERAMMGSAIQGSTFHKHATQEFILITSDKLQLKVIDYKERLEASIEWLTPLALVVTVLLTFLTADFKDTLGLSGDTWKAIFIVSGAIFLYWFGKSAFAAWKNNGQLEPDQFVAAIIEEVREEGADV